MTYQGHSSRPSNRVLIALVIITILLVAYWAANGGLDSVPVVDTSVATP